MARLAFVNSVLLPLLASACSAAPPPAECPSHAPLLTRIDRLEARLAELEETQGATVAPPPRAERPAPVEPAARTWDEIVDHIEKRFADDAPGDSASAAFEKKYARVFLLPAAKGATLEKIECRQSLCKAIVMLADGSILNNVFVQAMRDAQLGNASLRAHTEETPDGKVRVTYFVARTGGMPYP